MASLIEATLMPVRRLLSLMIPPIVVDPAATGGIVLVVVDRLLPGDPRTAIA